MIWSKRKKAVYQSSEGRGKYLDMYFIKKQTIKEIIIQYLLIEPVVKKITQYDLLILQCITF